MKVTYQIIGEDEEEEIVVRCSKKTAELERAVRNLELVAGGIAAFNDGKIYKINLGSVYYFEVVDNKSFIYCKKQVYECRYKLYEFQELTSGTHFFRATKSTVVNADKIECVAPTISGRFIATLTNGEKVMVSRQYVSALKMIMGIAEGK